MAIEHKLSPTHEAPYRGLRVLDFGQGIASPYCAMLLGIYGADVIKVEPPAGGLVALPRDDLWQPYDVVGGL